jgi:hypothetical protein
MKKPEVITKIAAYLHDTAFEYTISPVSAKALFHCDAGDLYKCAGVIEAYPTADERPFVILEQVPCKDPQYFEAYTHALIELQRYIDFLRTLGMQSWDEVKLSKAPIPAGFKKTMKSIQP